MIVNKKMGECYMNLSTSKKVVLMNSCIFWRMLSTYSILGDTQIKASILFFPNKVFV